MILEQQMELEFNSEVRERKRAVFASWEHHAYAVPSAMALEHGGGVSVAGRF